MNVNRIAAPVSVTSPGTVTISVASPTVIGKAAHGLLAGTPLTFSVSGGGGDVLPTGITAGTVYYVSATSLNANDFKIENANGVLVNVTAAGQGTFTATATNETLRIDVSHSVMVGLQVTNVGANPLDLFDVVGKFSDSGSEVVVASSAGNYTTPVYPIVRASASPVTLAAAASVWMLIDVTAFNTLIIRASSSAGPTTLTFAASAKDNT